MVGKRKPQFFYGYIVVAASFLIMVVMWGTYYSFGIFFKPLLTEFGWTRAMTSGAFSLSFLLMGFLGVATGRLNDRYGPRVVVMVCGFFLGLGYILVSQTSAVWQLYLFYGVVVAMGMSGAVVPLQSTIVRWFVKRRGMMNGIIVSGIGVGMLVMPPVANWLIASYGWRTSYIVVGTTVVIVTMLVAQFLRRDPAQMGQSPYGQGELEERGNSPTTGLSLQEAIRARQFWLLVLAMLGFTLSEGAVLVHIVPHAIGLGVPATRAAFILAIIGGISIGSRVVVGSASDQIGNKLAWMICVALLSVSLFWLLVAKELWMLYLFALIFGFGYGGLSVLLSPMVAEHFGLRSHGVIMAVMIMFGGTWGMALGPVLAGHIFDITGGYSLAFLIYGITSGIGFMLISRLKPMGSKEI